MNEKFNFKRLKTKQKYLLLAILVLAIAMALTVTMVIRNKGGSKGIYYEGCRGRS